MDTKDYDMKQRAAGAEIAANKKKGGRGEGGGEMNGGRLNDMSQSFIHLHRGHTHSSQVDFTKRLKSKVAEQLSSHTLSLQ